MNRCGARTKDGAICRNRPGNERDNQNLSYCHIHGGIQKANEHREPIKQMMAKRNYNQLETYIDENGVNIDLPIDEFDTLLLYAIYMEDSTATELIVRKGANTHTLFPDGIDSLTLAEMINQGEAGKLLNKADVYLDVEPMEDVEADHRKYLFIKMYWKWICLVALITFIFSNLSGWWPSIGVVLTIVSIVLFVKVFRSKRNDPSLTTDYRSSIWLFISGGFFILLSSTVEDPVTGEMVRDVPILEIPFTLLMLLFLGNFMLLIHSMIKRDQWLKRRMMMTFVLFILLILFV